MSFPRYPKYKASGVEWLGEVPEHWEMTRLGRVAVLNPSKSEVRHLDRSELVSFLPMEAVGEDGSLDLSRERAIGEVEAGYTYFRDGDVVIAKITPCFENGKGALMAGLRMSAGFGTSELIVVRPNPGMVRPDFLFHVSRSPIFRMRGEAEMYGAGGQKRVPDDFVRGYQLPLPSWQEQEEIAAFLDRETAKIDALVAEQQRLIELLKEKRQAVISHAVTKGLDPHAEVKPSGIEWLGDVPAHWDVVEIKKLAKPGTTITYGIVQAGPDIEGGVPYIRTSDMSGAELSPTGCMRTTPEIDAAYARSRVEEGDLVVAIRASLGKALLTPASLSGANLTQGTAKISPGHRITSRFLLWAFNSDYNRVSIRLEAKGTTFLEITLDSLRRLPFAIPPIREQSEIVASIESRTVEIDELLDTAERSIALLQERRTALISAAVTGHIDVRSFEPRCSLEGTAGSNNDDASLTISEAAFEAFCTDASIPFVRIPRKENERTADYLVNSGAQQFVVELKQFDPNEEEQAAIAARAEGKVVAQGGEPGSRIRLAIQNAAPQLRLSSAGRLPAMLVVYNCTGVNRHTDPYSVATAMQGLDVIDIAVPVETSESPKFGPPRSGPKKKMTANSHTSISAIAVLGYNLDGSMRLDVFHNRHAKNPLDPDMLRCSRVHHWRLPDGARSSLVEWDPV